MTAALPLGLVLAGACTQDAAPPPAPDPPPPADTGAPPVPMVEDYGAHCEQLGAGLERLTMTSFHGNAYFWEPRPLGTTGEPGFFLSVQGATEPGSVCDDLPEWDWTEQPTPDALYVILRWIMPPGDPNKFTGVYRWEYWSQYGLTYQERGFALNMLRYDERNPTYELTTARWWAPIGEKYEDGYVTMCVTEFTPDRVALKLVLLTHPDDGSAFNRHGFLVDFVLDVDPVPGDDACFEMKSAVDEGLLWSGQWHATP